MLQESVLSSFRSPSFPNTSLKGDLSLVLWAFSYRADMNQRWPTCLLIIDLVVPDVDSVISTALGMVPKSACES